MDTISEILNGFKTISLKQMDEVKLLNRFDSKYQFPKQNLYSMLNEIKASYFILEIKGQPIQQYKTTYYDTSNNLFYSKHHNGKLNRVKIRKREYLNSGETFLEIKKKNNKGKTRKIRIQTENSQNYLTADELEFLNQNTSLGFQISNSSLCVAVKNKFYRATLVNVYFAERCTIDFNLRFYSDNQNFAISEMAIIELKQGKVNMKSTLTKQLRKNSIHKQGFSKYCIGRAFLDPSLKLNLFKPKLLQLKKQYNGSLIYY